MNIRQYIIPFLFALATTYLIKNVILERIFLKDTQEISSGQAFHVTSSGELQRPLDTAVLFSPQATLTDGELSSVLETPQSEATFTRAGGALDRLVLKKIPGSIENSFEPIGREPRSAPGYAPFLVALADQTPWLYALEGSTFVAETDAARIEKQFTLLDNYIIDVMVTIDPRKGPVRPRIFVPAPRDATDAARDHVSSGIVNKGDAGLQYADVTKLAPIAYAHPTLFGLADRFLVQTLIGDGDGFAQRGYFTEYKSRVWAIIEGPEVTEKTTWHLKFYCGPKEANALHAADQRLTELLNYGWLAPICHGLLALLKFLYHYVFNYGIAVILVTCIINLLLIPLTSRSDMQGSSDFSKKLQYLEQKYKHDRERLALEKTELMRKHSPVDALGCAGIVIQMLLFFALNRVLSYSIELYKAPFFGWITDLSARDPYYLFAIIAGLAIIIPALDNKDPRQRMVSVGLGLVIGAVVAQLSAGLSLFIVTNLLFRSVATRLKKWLPA